MIELLRSHHLQYLGFDGSCCLFGVRDAEPELVCDHSVLPRPCPKLEGDDIRMLFLGGYLED